MVAFIGPHLYACACKALPRIKMSHSSVIVGHCVLLHYLRTSAKHVFRLTPVTQINIIKLAQHLHKKKKNPVTKRKFTQFVFSPINGVRVHSAKLELRGHLLFKSDMTSFRIHFLCTTVNRIRTAPVIYRSTLVLP